MKSCNRFEEEGLEVDMLSEEFAKHLQACAECQQAQAGYENLTQLLEQAQTPVALPLGWKENVWRAIEAQEKQVHTPSLWEKWRMALRPYRWVLGGFATAALVGLVFFSLEQKPSAPEMVLAKETAFSWNVFDTATLQIRSVGTARVGNQIHVKAHIPFASQAALFVYVQNRLVFSCSSVELGHHCQQTENTLKAQIPVEHIGLYRALWVVSSKPLPVFGQGFDADTAAFLSVGANIQHPFSVEVY
ncbi:MAG: hypothetical protein FWC28_04090 [Proteobacteria bacterium]|nr:hypothetical protein [Cystobacterineae bacterium]MCL2259241.1 hypothetical protein [Cystobacterineae bacterium]MCL2314418.1 hypothetical protein [Pseudomonadota bacterium]